MSSDNHHIAIEGDAGEWEAFPESLHDDEIEYLRDALARDVPDVSDQCQTSLDNPLADRSIRIAGVSRRPVIAAIESTEPPKSPKIGRLIAALQR